MTTYKSYIGGTDIQWWAGVGRTFTRKTSTGGQLSLNRVGSIVDVLEVYGSGTAYTDSAISTALGRVGSSSVGLLLQPGTWTISNDLTIPANTPLYLMPGAVLSVQPTKTLTINSQPEAGRYQIFAVVEDTEAGTIGEFSFATGLHLKSSWFASLTSATTIIDSDTVTLEITKAETVSSDTTVAATTTLLWLTKNILTISAAKTLTINGLIHAGLHQIFAATGTVTLGGLVKEVSPEWWGAVGDGTTDDTDSINNAITASSAGSKIYIAPSMACKITAPIVRDKSVSFLGGGKLVVAPAYSQSVFHLKPAADGLRDICDDDITIDTTDGSTQGSYIGYLFDTNNGYISFNEIFRMRILRAGTSVKFTGDSWVTDAQFTDCLFEQWTTCLHADSTAGLDVHTIIFDCCQFHKNGDDNCTFLKIERGYDWHFNECRLWQDGDSVFTIFDLNLTFLTDINNLVNINGGTWEIPIADMYTKGVAISSCKCHDIKRDAGGLVHNLFRMPPLITAESNLCYLLPAKWDVTNGSYTDPSEFHRGAKAAQFTFNASQIGQAVWYLHKACDPDRYLGEVISVIYWVKTTATKVRAWIRTHDDNDDTIDNYSDYHPGDGEYHPLSVAVTVAAYGGGATGLKTIFSGVYAESEASERDVYVAGPSCVMGGVIPFYPLELSTMLSPGVNTLADSGGDANWNPDVRGFKIHKTNNSSATTLKGLSLNTYYERVYDGYVVFIIFGDAYTTVDFTGNSMMKGNGGADFVAATGDHMTCVFIEADNCWYCDVSDNTS